MANNWKYTLQKHKGKLWLSGSILATAVVGTGVWLVVSEDSPFANPEDAVSYLASHVITSNAVGEVKLMSVATNETLNTMSLPVNEGYFYQATPDREAVYAYNGKELTRIFEKDGALNTEVLATGLPAVADVSDFAFSGNQLAVYSKEAKTVTVINTETKTVVNTVTEKEPVVALVVADTFTHYITDSELVRINQMDVMRLELGSSLLSLHEEKGKLVIHSAFGNAKGENVLFYVNGETMEIESLQKTGAPDSLLLSKDDGETHYMAGHYVKTEETPYYLLERYKVGAEGLTKDSLTVKVPIGIEQVDMNAGNSVLDHDYIYSHVADSLKVYDVKSQSFVSELAVDIDFAMPILGEEGIGGGEDA